MSNKIIAGMYELKDEIGAGGGGVVYLGTHIRLNKDVVLKADKRRLAAKPEQLRREVDALKNLNHTYIPQVYDFVEEDGIVYTVMDYVEGESLDKPLLRGERFSQPAVIEWGCELMEALQYLHSRPPHGILHADVKPANIMRTPEGDIRLIDFNIALALGEEGAVRVGFSRGYASPEHYGVSYGSGGNATERTGLPARTESVPDTGSAYRAGRSRPSGDSLSSGSSSSSTSGKPAVLLDVRSDVYSAGATLYHLLSGVKPDQDARKVVPIPAEMASPAVIDIIRKAMEPDPDRRYQTAAEMLHALEHLHENDPRMKRHKRRIWTAALCLSVLFLAGGTSAFAGLKQMEQEQAAAAAAAKEAEEAERQAKELERLAKEKEQREKDALSAVRNSENAYAQGNVPSALRFALKALQGESPYAAQAQKALTDALGVYDLSDGLKPWLTVELPSEALKLSISPEGTRTAALYAYRVSVLETETGNSLADLPARNTAMSDMIFLSEDVLLYSGEEGLCCYDLAANRELWRGAACTSLTLSADGSRAAAVNPEGSEAVVYNTATGEPVKTVSFEGRRFTTPAGGGILADPPDDLFALNRDGSLLAVSFEGGRLFLFDVSGGESFEVFGETEFARFDGGFYDQYFAVTGLSSEGNTFVALDTAEMKQTGGFSGRDRYLSFADERGVCVTENNLLVEINPVTGENSERAFASADIEEFTWGKNGYFLMTLSDGSYALYDGNKHKIAEGARESGNELLATAGSYVTLASYNTPTVQVLKLETHPEAQVAVYDPDIPHIEARLSEDRTTLMLFRYDRFDLFRLDGTLIAQVELPNAMQVYDQQYRRENGESRLEVTYYDGLIRAYSAVDGSILWERQGEIPDKSLQENFETSRWRIEAPLHESPMVYDRQTGEKVGELEADSYLTYVTEVGDYLVTQYVMEDGGHYALLLNQNFETLARLPDLCDVIGDTLVFDDDKGNIRQSRLYSVQELQALAQTK